MTGTPSTAPVIDLKNIGVRYRSRRAFFRYRYFEALKDVSLSLYPGDSLGVVGRNGVGKSTLLRVIAGIIVPDSGSVSNMGVRTTLLALQAGFDQELTGRSNAVLSGMLLGFSQQEVLGRMDRIVNFSELGRFIDEPVKTYSSGMRARLGFSIAVQMKPDVLLIDEVLGVGDAEFRKKSEKSLREKIHSDQTVVLVSHNAQQVKKLCNRVVWIEEGVTRMEGNTKTVVEAYEDYILQTPPTRSTLSGG